MVFTYWVCFFVVFSMVRKGNMDGAEFSETPYQRRSSTHVFPEFRSGCDLKQNDCGDRFGICIESGVHFEVALYPSQFWSLWSVEGNRSLEEQAPFWMSVVLVLAAVYNVLWGGFAVLAPDLLFTWADMTPPRYPGLWQCIGMIVGVYGVGYFVAAWNPVRHWPIVLVGLLGKLFGPIGFVASILQGPFTVKFGLTILTNDLIWWIPFSLILLHAYRQFSRRSGNESEDA